MATTKASSDSSSKPLTFDPDKVSNLKTTDKEITAMIKKSFSDAGNSNDRGMLQQLLSDRSNKASLLSNMYKTLEEMKRSVIQNIRP